MMKKISSIITLLFIACSIILGGGSALAADDPVIAPPNGDLTIHKYLYDEEGVAGVISDGKQLNDIPDELDGKEIRGVQFDVYKVGKPTEAYKDVAPEVVPGGDGWTYEKVSDAILKVTNGAETYEYSITDNDQSGKTDDNGELKLTDLPRSYYFVVENLTNSTPEMSKDGGKNWEAVQITKPVKPFVVAVPMTDPENLNDWITNVHVYPKNQTTDVIKEPSQPSVNVGDEFSWSIAVELPADIKDYKKFIVTDTLDKALTYTPNSVEVYQAEKNSDGKWVKVNSENKLDKTNDYETTEPGQNEKGGTLKVDLIHPEGFVIVGD
ncbi:MAG: SpaH/EbpB family LPXTG-anchored major pilin, partial [Enterococcus gilvus]